MDLKKKDLQSRHNASADRRTNTVHLDLDSAWPPDILGLPRRDLGAWGPILRYVGRRRDVDRFAREVIASFPSDQAPFILYGSGDFHYLVGLLLRRFTAPLILISFDNHPDWDIRPPHWACGGWINRALEQPNVRKAIVWGCGNFELAWPGRLFANRRALRGGKLEVHAWAERFGPGVQRRFNCMTRANWRQRFETFATGLAGCDLYITIDLDCLRAEEAITNWENGLFEPADIAWAIGVLRRHANIIGGDLCGAWSPPIYARWTQRFAGNWDHPRIIPPDPAHAARINQRTLEILWPALAGSAA